MAKKTYTVTETREVTPEASKLNFERHDLERTACIRWNKVTGVKEEPTMIEEIRERIAENGFWWGRMDIFMVNLIDPSTNNVLDQYCVEPTKSGKPQFGAAGEYMTAKEKQWCREENARIIEAEKKYNIPGVLLRY